ncbi:hypothetical protein ESCO_001488 [Escovopsis weberi]|uniref:Uncharacterized protein n=1 Tax=Escovopsis weberi TaxID=150374 RepID=A0A0M8N6K0_ESCWE|nr:hypothetical protein ESCO_001488 [Escovopsis weberi]
MCTTNIYTYIYPDGRRETSEQATLCSSTRHNKPCSNNVVFQHPHHFVHYADGASGASPSSSYLPQFPPTPNYTPRSGTPNHRSGDESDRSRRSSSSSHRRASSSIYINGQKVVNLGRHDGPPSRHERIVLVDGPPTPRTPPQAFNFPHTAPTSPNIGTGSPYLGSSPRESASGFSRRPVIVDERPCAERPRIQVAVPVQDGPRSPVRSSSKRDSQTSLSSREGRGGSGGHSGDEAEARRRRREREERRAEKDREEEEERLLKMRAKIAKANAEINKRPPVPVPPAPVRASSFSSKMAEAGSVVDKLAEGVKGMTFEEERREEKARRLAEKEQREEDEAQRQRLAERMMPRRRATVGPGSRRHRTVYDDGVYRWE